MAVYSNITTKELANFLNKYDIGYLKKYEGILEGIENTNYKIETSKNKFILTIFEKRVNLEDIPFFIDLKKHLINKKFSCPKPIPDKLGNCIGSINGKSCVLVSFLEGNKINNPSTEQCEQVGSVLSILHNSTLDFSTKRKNNMGLKQWEKIFLKCKSAKSNKYKNLLPTIEKELKLLNEKWPKNLPKGIIHADVFKDNVFFIKNKFSGLIDFYFSCFDFFSYDIALTVNAWCFDKENIFDKHKFFSLIKGYENNRILSTLEKSSLPLLLKGAAMRIMLTRLHDDIFHPSGAFVEIKNPNEYFKILKFHKNNKVQEYL